MLIPYSLCPTSIPNKEINHGDPTLCAQSMSYTFHTLPTQFTLSLHIVHSPYTYLHSPYTCYTFPTHFTLFLHILHSPYTLYTLQAHLHSPYTCYTLPTHCTFFLHILHSVSIFYTLSTYITLSKHIPSGHTAPPIVSPSANVSNGCMSRPTPTTKGGEHLTR